MSACRPIPTYVLLDAGHVNILGERMTYSVTGRASPVVTRLASWVFKLSVQE